MKNRYAIDDEERRTKPISFKMRPSHYEQLLKQARFEDRSITSIIERALIFYFKKHKEK